MNKIKPICTPKKIIEFLGKSNRIYASSNRRGYSVTALLGCERKAFFQKTFTPFDKINLSLVEESVWKTTRGNFLHNITQAYSWNELEVEYPLTVDGKNISVFGRLDCYDPDEKCIIEIKSRENVSESIAPDAEHVIQLQVYGTIFGNTIPVERLILVYLDMNNVASFDIPLNDMNAWIRERVSFLENSVAENKMPEGKLSSFCDLCNYQDSCSRYPGGVIEPKTIREPKR